MEHKCPVCGCTKYIEFGQLRGGYELVLSDYEDEKKVIEEQGINSDYDAGISYHPNKFVKCYGCGKRYKPTEV